MPRLPPVRSSAADQGDQDARAGRADRVAHGGGAAVDVDLVVGDAEVAHREHGDAGEGLVDLEQVDVGDGPAGLGQQASIAPIGAVVNWLGSPGVGGVGDDAGDGFEALFCGGARRG